MRDRARLQPVGAQFGLCERGDGLEAGRRLEARRHGLRADFSDGGPRQGREWLTRLDNVVFVLLCATSFYYILIVPLQACFDWSSLDEASDNVIFVLNYVADAVSLSANGRRLYGGARRRAARGRPPWRTSATTARSTGRPRGRRRRPPTTIGAAPPRARRRPRGVLPTLPSGKVVTLADISQDSGEHERRTSIFSRETCAVVFWPLVEFLAALASVEVVLYAAMSRDDAALSVCCSHDHAPRPLAAHLLVPVRTPALAGDLKYSKAKFLFVITVSFFLATSTPLRLRLPARARASPR